MRRTYRKLTGRKRRTMKTLKIRGGNLDDPDTKDFVNSKIEALEQKISEMESNMPVQIGFRPGMTSNGPNTSGTAIRTPLLVNKNISVNDFWNYVGLRTADYVANPSLVTIFLPALYSLPNVRGLNINYCSYSFSAGNAEDNELLSARNSQALNSKYPGLFTK